MAGVEDCRLQEHMCPAEVNEAMEDVDPDNMEASERASGGLNPAVTMLAQLQRSDALVAPSIEL